MIKPFAISSLFFVSILLVHSFQNNLQIHRGARMSLALKAGNNEEWPGWAVNPDEKSFGQEGTEVYELYSKKTEDKVVAQKVAARQRQAEQKARSEAASSPSIKVTDKNKESSTPAIPAQPIVVAKLQSNISSAGGGLLLELDELEAGLLGEVFGGTPLDRLAKLEETFLGERYSGALKPRLQSLKQELYGSN
jgi:hypothetical protein